MMFPTKTFRLETTAVSLEWQLSLWNGNVLYGELEFHCNMVVVRTIVHRQTCLQKLYSVGHFPGRRVFDV